MDASQDYVPHVIALRVKHTEGVELILHAQIKESRIGLKHHASVQIHRPKSVLSGKGEILRQEVEVVNVSCSETDGMAELFVSAKRSPSLSLVSV